MEKEQNKNSSKENTQEKNTIENEKNIESKVSQDKDKEEIKELTPEEEIKELTPEEEIKELTPEEEINNLKDRLTRTFAEMENQRRRFEKEKNDAFDYGGFSFAKEALNLIDNLERAKQSLENDESLKNTVALEKTIEHFKIINKELISIFEKNNIKPIESIDKKLDPNLHQAMIEIEDSQKEPGTIIQEIQKGFTIKDRLLRPSLVGVSKKPVKKAEKNQENQDK